MNGIWVSGHGKVRVRLPSRRGISGQETAFYIHPQPNDPYWTNSFDVLFRGLELATGGQGLHEYADYERALADRGEVIHPYESYLQTFRHGMPPHGGFASDWSGGPHD
jgi:nondiscriminating aspartyl-tRNA synthetase